MARRDHTSRNVLLVGGAGLAAWWLLSRGKGWGLRSPESGAADETPRPSRVVVWIRANRLEIDGVVANLATVVAKSRAVGTAEVHATGDAITHVIRDVLASLVAANVKLALTPDLARLFPSVVA